MSGCSGRRKRVGAVPDLLEFGSAELCGGGERDRVSELFELSYEAMRLAFGVLTGCEVVVAEVVEAFSGGEEMPDHVEQAVRDGDGRLVRASSAGDLTVLGAEVAALGSRCSASSFDERLLEPLVAWRCGHASALARGLVVAGA